MATNLLGSTSLRCTTHRDAPATLRCDQCRRPFCRDCLTSRWITSRSSVWLCRSCARGSSGWPGWGRPSGWGAPTSGVGAWLTRYWWLLAAVAALAWLSSFR
ncbi:MAG TPA: B-box zinc finger protein [Chloroflexota bacterium]|jgi:hypothetical protein